METAAKEISSEDGEVLLITVDVGDSEPMFSAVKSIEDKWGRLDILFADAGVNGVWAPLQELRVEEWDETIRINLRGTFLTVKAALPLLQKQGGSIIVTSSVNGTRMFSNAGASAYATTKAAQAAFAKMLAVELGKQKIRVNVICPGKIETDINDNTDDRAPEGLAPRVEFPEGNIPLTAERPGTAQHRWLNSSSSWLRTLQVTFAGQRSSSMEHNRSSRDE